MQTDLFSMHVLTSLNSKQHNYTNLLIKAVTICNLNNIKSIVTFFKDDQIIFAVLLVLVGSNIAVSVDIAATKHKRQDCDVDGTAQDCNTQISNVDADSFISNLTEYRIRTNAVTTIMCTEPCLTPF